MCRSPELLKYFARELFHDPLGNVVCQGVDEEKYAKSPTRHTVFLNHETLLTKGFSERLYARLPTGKFIGQPKIIWNGMNSFVFAPDTRNPFTYVTASGRPISPGIMETSGGDAPKFIKNLSAFSLWEYAPAFIIHDWILTAHKCNYPPDNDFTFSQSSLILAEAMKTLTESGYTDLEMQQHKLPKNPDFIYLIYQATRSCIVEDIWDNPSSVKCFSQPQSSPA